MLSSNPPQDQQNLKRRPLQKVRGKGTPTPNTPVRRTRRLLARARSQRTSLSLNMNTVKKHDDKERKCFLPICRRGPKKNMATLKPWGGRQERASSAEAISSNPLHTHKRLVSQTRPSESLSPVPLPALQKLPHTAQGAT